MMVRNKTKENTKIFGSTGTMAVTELAKWRTYLLDQLSKVYIHIYIDFISTILCIQA